jgi:hypothetical protein
MYDVASVDSDTQITLSAPYAGTTASGVVYAIGTGFTVPDNFPEMSQGDIETATIFTRAMRKIQGKITGIESNTTNEIGQAVNDHVALPDPHTQYLKESEYEAHRSREDLFKQATLSLDFANNKYEVYEGPVNSLTQMPFNEVLDFTRASAATARTATGKIQEVLTDEQRLVGNREGLLIEEARTNLFKFSEMGDAYVLNGSAVKGGTDVANGVSLKELIPNAGSASQGTSTPGFDFATGHSQAGDYFFSCVLKQSGITKVIVRRKTTAVYPFELCRVDLVAGTFVSSVPGCTLEPFGDGAYLLSAPYSAISTTASGYYVGAYDPASTDGVNSFYVGAVQLEQGSFPTSYIPTAGTQVTRAGDNCVRVLGDEFNKDAFTLFVEFEESGPFDELVSYAVLSQDQMASTKGFFAIQRRDNYNSLGLRLNNGGFTTIDTPASVGLKKAAAAYQNGEVTFCLNGVILGSQNNVRTNDITSLFLGKFDNTAPTAGLTLNKELRIFPTALSDAELITLTGGT